MRLTKWQTVMLNNALPEPFSTMIIFISFYKINFVAQKIFKHKFFRHSGKIGNKIVKIFLITTNHAHRFASLPGFPSFESKQTTGLFRG